MFREGGCGDHGCVIGGKTGGGEIVREAVHTCDCSPQSGIAGNPSSDNYGFGTDLFGRRDCAPQKFVDDCGLEAGQQIESALWWYTTPTLDRRLRRSPTDCDLFRHGF